MAMKYIKNQSLPRMNDPILNRALEQINEELDKIARVFIDWTDATQDFKTLGTLEAGNATLGTIASGAITSIGSPCFKRAAADCDLHVETYDTDPGDYSKLHLRTSDSDTIDTLSETQDNDYIGMIRFSGVDSGSGWAYGAYIRVQQNGAAGADYVPTDLTLVAYSATGSNADQLVLVNDGTITASGCITDGTCEIMKDEDALAIIDDILKTGSGKKDKYNHERMDMKKIYKKYPYMIYERKGTDEEGNKTIEYYDKLGAKSDLLYVAIGQLVGRVEALEARFNN